MTINHHPFTETLAAYAAGSLSAGPRLAVASHLEHCPACRKAVAGFEAAGGVMMDGLPPTAMEADAYAHLMARIDGLPAAGADAAADADSDLPACLRPYVMGPWRWMGPGVHMRPILVPDAEGESIFLLRGRAGTRLPEHSHTGAELTSIISGSYTHAGGTFAAGDFEEADEDVEHRPVVGPEGECLCLVSLGGQLRLSGILGALLNPFVRF